MRQTVDFTEGSIPKKIFLFALPLMIGSVLQQLYNVVDTIVVGRFLGKMGIWMSIPIGWALADMTGIIYGLVKKV